MPGSRIRVAIVTTYPPGTGSLNEYAFHFVQQLRTKPEIGEVIVLADELPHGAAYPAEPPTPGIAPIQILPCWRYGARGNAARIVAAVRRMQPDIVMFNIQFASFGQGKVAASLGLLAPSLMRAIGVPTFIILHNIMETVDIQAAGYTRSHAIERLIRGVGSIVTRRLLAADRVAVTIPKYVDILEAKYGATNVLLAPHGAFNSVTLPATEPTDGPMQILTFGKFGTYKKVDTLLEAYKIIRERHTTNVKLVIAGTDSPHTVGYLAEMQARYAALPDVEFTGYVAEEDVPRLFTEATVVVFPYTSTTGSSGVLHQAGSFGKAVVLPNLGDLAEVVTEEGYTGEFFAPGDADSLATAIGKVLSDRDYRIAMGTRNYLAAQGLPIGEVVDWYVLHIQTLLADRQHVPAGRIQFS